MFVFWGVTSGGTQGLRLLSAPEAAPDSAYGIMCFWCEPRHLYEQCMLQPFELPSKPRICDILNLLKCSLLSQYGLYSSVGFL